MKLVLSPLTVAVCDAALTWNETEACPAESPLQECMPQLNAATRPLVGRARRCDTPGRMTMSKDGSITSMRGTRVPTVCAGLLLLVGTARLMAQAPIAPPLTKTEPVAKPAGIGSNPAASSLDAYLTRVRLDNKAVQTSPGAIWSDSGRLTRMSTDVRAMRPHDLISVVVSESLAASTDGTVKNSRASNASSGISGLIGTLHAANALQNLVNQTSSSGLNAQGTSATNSSLTTTFGGQVVEVLPNGMLVIEAARQVEFSQQTQTIILRGLVRPEDISQENQVLSTAISSMELQVRGKGIVNDYTHRQNLLVRLLERVLIF